MARKEESVLYINGIRLDGRKAQEVIRAGLKRKAELLQTPDLRQDGIETTEQLDRRQAKEEALAATLYAIRERVVSRYYDDAVLMRLAQQADNQFGDMTDYRYFGPLEQVRSVARCEREERRGGLR